MKNLKLLFISILLLIIGSCSKESLDDSKGNEKKSNLYYLDISKDTNADFLLIYPNGAVACVENYDKTDIPKLAIIKTSLSDQNNSMSVLFDETGNPKSIYMNGYLFLISNLQNNLFNLAIVTPDNQKEYYWNLPLVGTNANQLVITRSEEHWIAVKYAAKVLSTTAAICGAIVAATALSAPIAAIAVIGGTVALIDFLLDEQSPQMLDDIDDACTTYEWITEIKKPQLSTYFSLLFDQVEITADKHIGIYQKNREAANIVDDAIWADFQLKLQRYVLECSSEIKTYTVGINTKTYWVVDDSNVDKSWCQVKKENGQIRVDITKEYESPNSRQCVVTIKQPDDNVHVPAVKLIIIQHGASITLSKSVLVFSEAGGTEIINVQCSNNVKSWKITSAPDWCGIKESKESFSVSVKPYYEENQYGVVTVTAQIEGTSPINRNVEVSQIVGLDGTKWNFSGLVTFDGESDKINFGIQFIDLANGQYKFYGDAAGFEKYCLIQSYDLNKVVMKYNQSVSENGVSVKTDLLWTFERTGQNAMHSFMSGKFSTYIPEIGSETLVISGKFTGSLETISSNEIRNNHKNIGLPFLFNKFRHNQE